VLKNVADEVGREHYGAGISVMSTTRVDIVERRLANNDIAKSSAREQGKEEVSIKGRTFA